MTNQTDRPDWTVRIIRDTDEYGHTAYQCSRCGAEGTRHVTRPAYRRLGQTIDAVNRVLCYRCTGYITAGPVAPHGHII